MLTVAQLDTCRRVHEQVMTDECTIRHPGGTTGAFDPETGTYPTTPHPPFYPAPGAVGVCTVQADPAAAREVLVTGQEVALRVYVVRVPWHVTDVAADDLLTVAVSADPLLSGAVLTVTDVQASTFATARRLLCVWPG